MLTLQDIRDAHARIHESIYRSPCVPSQTLGDITGSRVLLKLENLQMTGSFKERGALNTLLQLSPEERSRGVVAASAGNHAQGVAYHAARMKSRSVIVMPENTPLTKVTSTKRFGAEVILHGVNYDEAYGRALELAEERGYVLIHPFDDERIIAGQGTVGLEILEDAQPDAVIVPIGGGGLISGVACAIKEQRPECKIIGVEAANAPSMKAAVEAGYPVDVPVYASIADGIIVKQPGVHTLKAAQKYVDEIVVVEEEEIAAAVIMLLDIEKTVVEGAGAVGLAALMFRSLNLKGKRVVIVLSGGNIDLNLLSRIIERGLIKDGRMAKLRIELLDIPGQLAIVSDCVSKLKANVVEVYHNRSFFDAPLGKTYLDVTLETRGRDHIEEVAAALRHMGYKVQTI
ncbi:MAG: threonine ammonia-lyase [Candidatus Hinthialibacter antarcticus]|nr:threonine ammonia-lyase [Candidatus Hinthialibacter antarcticus]